MKFGIAEIVSQEFLHRSKVITNLSDEIEKLLCEKSLSNIIDGLYLGFVCVPDKSRSFYQQKKPRLSRKDNFFEYRIFFDLENMLKLSDEELKKSMLNQMIDSSGIIKLKVKDFNIDEYIKILKDVNQSASSDM